MTYIEIKLSMPPSVNTAYAGKTIRHKSKQYKDWLSNMQYEFLSKNNIIDGDEWLKVTYQFHFPLYNKDGSKKVKDVFNYEKLTSDFLCTIIKGFDDHKIKIGVVEKINSLVNDFVIVKIEELTLD